MKRYAIVAVVCALALPVALAEGAGGTTEGSCPPGSWIKVTVTSPNGDVGTTEVRRDIRELPEGYSVVGTGSGGERVVIHRDGRIEASGGKAAVLCRPNH